MTRYPISYILPIKVSQVDDSRDLEGYLQWLSERVQVIAVDASAPDLFEHHATRWAVDVHVQPNPRLKTLNGKVWGVLTGLELAAHDFVIVADDDVRYDNRALSRINDLLHRAEIVRPQNYFRPVPWHAAWDTGRTLLNRISGGDWPGTLALRKSFLGSGYGRDSLFENLQMVRSVQASGGREYVARDLYVRRIPPTTRHFVSQRVRQAYDEWARPARFAWQLALLPALTLLALKGPATLPFVAAAVIGAAEAGRRQAGGRAYFPLAASLLAPLWLTERMFCAWLALATRLIFGGVRYHGAIIREPATSVRELRALQASDMEMAG